MIETTEDKIDLSRVMAAVADPAAGGVAIFIGRVRNLAEGRAVERMEYEGYPEMIIKELKKIATTACERWPVQKYAIVQRLGMLELGETSVAIAVACAHRHDAFAACQFMIDTLKKRVPVWKKEFGPHGSRWVDGVLPGTEIVEKESKK